MRNASLSKLAYVLALIGGIILLIQGILSLIGMAVSFPVIYASPLGHFGYFAIITIILGIVAIYGSKRLKDLMWAVVLLIVGFVAGGLGGLLVLLGAICALILHFI